MSCLAFFDVSRLLNWARERGIWELKVSSYLYSIFLFGLKADEEDWTH